ncbi:MAG: rhodanese-like domain-containing protein [Pseudomonadota bacterium]
MIFFAITVAGGLPLATFAQGPHSNLAGLMKQLSAEYPNIVHLTRAEIVEQLGEIVLVDVRQPEEYMVSHIPGAIHMTDLERLGSFVKSQDKQVVLYCSVGYRSAETVQSLRDQGIDGVSNFAGSIFDWANHGLPLKNASGPTDRVHPYSWFWGWRYLQPQRHAD